MKLKIVWGNSELNNSKGSLNSYDPKIYNGSD
jgi:hypothetical protein